MFLGVPRVWEKIAAALKKKVREAPPPSGVKACIVSSAKAKGLQFQKDRQLGGSGAVPCCYCIATGTVQKKVKALERKLFEIGQLQQKKEAGEALDANQLAKLGSKAEVEDDLAAWSAALQGPPK